MKYGKVLISRGGSTTRIRAIGAVICANLRGTVRIQIGVSDGKDCRREEWKTKHDTPFRVKLRQRTIRESLLTLQRFDQCVRKVQILFQRKSTGANRLSGTHETDKV